MMIIEFNINFNLIDITLNYVYCCINFKNTKSNNKIANRRFRDSARCLFLFKNLSKK